MNFEDAVEFILKQEGGYNKHPKDPGGETNFGISKNSYPNVDIPKLTRSDAIAIYNRDFWQALQIEKMPKLLRLAVFDCAINQGPRFAIGTLQAILDLKIDGIIGPKTIEALQKVDANFVYRKFLFRRHDNYTRSPRWAFFGAGWTKRLLDVAVESFEKESKNNA